MQMQISEKELEHIIGRAVDNAFKRLMRRGVLPNASVTANAQKPMKEKTPYQKTESLLFNYLGFKKIIREKEQEIEDLRTYGVPECGGAVVQYRGDTGGKPRGIVLDEEKIEAAVQTVEKTMEAPRQAIELVEKGLKEIANDPYYKVVEMQYFEGRTQEDIGLEFKCTQPNIAYHRRRLVGRVALVIFPDKVASENIE